MTSTVAWVTVAWVQRPGTPQDGVRWLPFGLMLFAVTKAACWLRLMAAGPAATGSAHCAASDMPTRLQSCMRNSRGCTAPQLRATVLRFAEKAGAGFVATCDSSMWRQL